MLRAPFWVMHPLLCENLTVRGVHVQNDGPNGDGCDPESCKNVLIEGCFFDTGDDCIAIKSGRNRDGRRWNIPTENVIVRHDAGHALLRIIGLLTPDQRNEIAVELLKG
ncbi:glycosyl hydrolase family 28 protein, partial [uncultured Duncaniella sp.]|uniref:glycosyl hydrolase family 28 protein n=1 Tax=uncultured Duncaniella sp. TaxID=2768039 RepID=UPI0025AE2403